MKKNMVYSALWTFAIMALVSATSFADDKSENLRTCLDGNYPSLCKHHLLTPNQLTQAKEAERRANLRTCLDGNYPSLCKYRLLSPNELKQAKEAEKRVNLKTCLDGNYPSLCKYSLLSQSELAKAKEAEKKVNLRTCLDGNYPNLCKYHLLSEDENKASRAAETKAAKSKQHSNPKIGAAPRSRGGACYEASIMKPSPFMGNDGEIFKLDDGSLWEVKYEYEYLYEYYPDVIICPSKGTLVIDGKSLDVEYVGR